VLTPCANRHELFRDPVRRWLTTGHNVIWAYSPTLCGLATWGRADAAETREVLEIFDGYHHLAPQFDILMDATGVEGLELDALGELLAWLRGNPAVFERHLRHRIGVIPGGVPGLALAGLTTAIGIQAPVTVLTDAREGFRMLLPDGGDALCDEIAGLVAECQGVPPMLLALRRVLAEHHGAIDLAHTARQLGVSTRSLQRVLGDAGRSFRVEQADARFRAAEILLESDDKLVTGADRLGLSEDGLTLLVRGRTGLTPTELRKKLRGA